MQGEVPSRRCRAHAVVSRPGRWTGPKPFQWESHTQPWHLHFSGPRDGGLQERLSGHGILVICPWTAGVLLSVQFLPTLDCAWLWTYTGGRQRAGDGCPSPVTKPKRHFSQQDTAQLAGPFWGDEHSTLLIPLCHQVALGKALAVFCLGFPIWKMGRVVLTYLRVEQRSRDTVEIL